MQLQETDHVSKGCWVKEQIRNKIDFNRKIFEQSIPLFTPMKKQLISYVPMDE